VKLKKQLFGRSMHHKDMRRCSVGVFGFYLLFHLHKSGELDDCCCPNFGVNKDWFNIKILTDGTWDRDEEENPELHVHPANLKGLQETVDHCISLWSLGVCEGAC
jgi:hypothetical protein